MRGMNRAARGRLVFGPTLTNGLRRTSGMFSWVRLRKQTTAALARPSGGESMGAAIGSGSAAVGTRSRVLLRRLNRYRLMEVARVASGSLAARISAISAGEEA